MKKKICIVTSSFPSHKNEATGAGIFVRDFARLLAQKDIEVHVLAPKTKFSKYDDDLINVHFFPWLGGDVGLSTYSSMNPFHLIKMISVVLSGIRFTTKFMKNNDVDSCLAMWAVPSGLFCYISKFFNHIPYSVWILGSDIWKIKNYPFGKFILKKVLKNAKQLFSDGYVLSDDVKHISKRECSFLPSSRILEKNSKNFNYTKFDLTKKNFLFLGRYHANKGIDLLIDSIALLDNNSKQNSLFHIFGGGPMEKQIIQKVKDLNLNNVFINGFLDNDKVFSLMSKSDFLIIPSRIESIPIVLSDALFSQVPVIVTNVGDMKKIVIDNNVGFVSEPTSISISNSLLKAIRLDSSERQIFVNNTKKAHTIFDLKCSVDMYLKNL